MYFCFYFNGYYLGLIDAYLNIIFILFSSNFFIGYFLNFYSIHTFFVLLNYIYIFFFIHFFNFICSCLFLLSDSFYFNPGHLNDVRVCSKTIELEVGQRLQYKYLLDSCQLNGRLGGKGHQYRSS